MLPYADYAGQRLPVPYVNLYAGNGFVAVPVSGHAVRRRGVPRSSARSIPGRDRGPGAGRRARVRRRRRALHHPAGARRESCATAFDVLPSPARVHRADPRAVARRARAARVASRSRRARRRDRRGHPRRRGRRRAARVPARAARARRTSRSSRAIPTHPARRARSRCPAGRRTSSRRACARETGVVRARVVLRSAPTTAASATTPRSSSRPTARSSRARARRTCRSPRATTRTRGSGPATRAGRSRRSSTGAFGFPTCWDQWFPETSRAFALARRRGARVPDRDRLRARPSRLRHRAAVGAGDPRPGHHERHLHDRGRTAPAPKAR